MSNKITAIKKIEDAIERVNMKLLDTDKRILEISANVRTASTGFMNMKLPSEVDSKLTNSSELVRKLTEQVEKERLAKVKLQTQITKLATARGKNTQKTAEEIQNNKILARNVREAGVLSSKLSTEYQKQSVMLTKLIRRQQDLATKQKLGSGLNKKEKIELDELTRAIRRKDEALKKVDANVGRFQRNVGNYRSALRSAAGAARGLASAMGLIGGAFLIVRVMREAIGVVREYGKANATLSGILQVERHEMQGLVEDSQRLGATTVKTANDVAKLQIAYARLGFSQDQIIQLTEATISGSIAMNAELDKTANLVGAVVNTFDSFTALDAPEIIDILSLATAKSALNFEKLETGIPIVAGAANAAGIPFTKLVALLGKLADSGIDVSSSSTALRNIFIESAKQGLGYGQILEKIKGSQDKLTASNDEFGKRAAVSATVLASNIEKTNELDEALQNAAGTSESMANKELDTLDGALQLVRSAFEGYILGADGSSGASEKLKEGLVFLAKNFDKVLGYLFTSIKIYAAYKIAVFLARQQQALLNRQLILSRAASIKAASGVSKLTLAWSSFGRVLKANLLGIAIAAIYGLIQVMNALNKSIGETVEEVHSFSEEFVTMAKHAAKTNEAITTMVDRYEELKKKTKLNKAEQKELNEIIKKIAKNVPEAVTEVDKYGVALGINADKAREFAKANGQILSLEAGLNITKLSNALEDLQKKQEATTRLQQNNTAAFVKGFGAISNIDGALFKVTTTFTKSGRAITDTTRLTKLQELEYRKYVKAVDEGVKTIQQDIEANEDIIATATGVKNARQLAGEAAAEEAEEIKEAQEIKEQEVFLIRRLKAELVELKVRLNDLVKDGYDNITAAQASEIVSIRELISQKEKEINAITGTTKKRKEVQRVLRGSISFYEAIIKSLKIEQSTLATSNQSYQEYQKKIDAATEAIKKITEAEKELNKVRFEGEGLSVDRLREQLELAFQSDSNERELENKREQNRKKYELDKEYAEKRKDLEKGIVTGILDLTNALFDRKIQQYDDEIQANRDNYSEILANENLTEENRSAIEAQRDAKEARLEKKKRDEQRKQAVFNKSISLAEVVINTAQSVSKTSAQLGFPAAIPFIALAVAQGAVQAAAIAAQPIPKYKHGRKDGKAELAYVGDGYVNEFIQKPDGHISMTPNRPTLTWLGKGDKVLKDKEALAQSLGGNGVIGQMSQSGPLMYYDRSNDLKKAFSDNTDRMIKAMSKKNYKNIINLTNNVSEDIKYALKGDF